MKMAGRLFTHARHACVVAFPVLLTMMRHKRAQPEHGTAGAASTARILIAVVWHPGALDLVLTMRRFEVWREAQALIYALACLNTCFRSC